MLRIVRAEQALYHFCLKRLSYVRFICLIKLKMKGQLKTRKKRMVTIGNKPIFDDGNNQELNKFPKKTDKNGKKI